MHVTFQHPIAQGHFDVPNDLVEFFVWLADKRGSKRAHAMLILVSLHDCEPDAAKQRAIRDELDQLLANPPL